MKIIARNKKASHNYHLLDTFEAGIVLVGTEIKSVRANKVNIADSYCIIFQSFVINCYTKWSSDFILPSVSLSDISYVVPYSFEI